MGGNAPSAIAALLALSITSWARAGQVEPLRPELMLTVRTYDAFGVSADDLSDAQTAVVAVFREIGIAIDWVNCYSGDRTFPVSSPRCTELLDPAEVILRITAAPRGQPSHPRSMGFTFVNMDEEKRPGLATVLADRVLAVASSAATNTGSVLGLVIAHELGHVLLHTTAHAKSGLMRSVWTHSELRDARPSDRRFLRTDVEKIRNRIGSRIQPAD
jgi:hypothetical protein